MSLLIETIKIENKKIFNIDYHQKRFDSSREKMFGNLKKINLNSLIKSQLPDNNLLIKCRIIYGREIENIEFSDYKKKKINIVRLVYDDTIDYSLKYEDRSIFKRHLEENSDVDEVIIVKKGEITDTSYTNIVFHNGKEWHTPLNPLLKGTKRAQLLDEKKIFEKKITLNDLKYYRRYCFINAFRDLE